MPKEAKQDDLELLNERQEALDEKFDALTTQIQALAEMVSKQGASNMGSMDMRVVNPLAVMIKNPSPEPLYIELGLTPQTLPKSGQCYGYQSDKGKWLRLLTKDGNETPFVNQIKVISLKVPPAEQSALTAAPDKSPTVSYISNGLNAVNQEIWTKVPSRISIRAWVGMLKTSNMALYTQGN